MKQYLELSWKYLKAHKKRTRMTILSVVMAVTLVVTIFSMLDTLIQYERNEVLKSEGNYHILIRKPTREEIARVNSRSDVESSGSLKYFGYGELNGKQWALANIDEKFAGNLNFKLVSGSFPRAEDEIMIEKWAMDSFQPKLGTGGTIKLALPGNGKADFTISGIYDDLGATKAAGIPGVFLSPASSLKLTAESDDFFILFKKGVDITRASNEIIGDLGLSSQRFARNEKLLALMLQSRNNRVREMYALGGLLFILVLLTAVVMIYNTFNISVMERVQSFGMIKCVGASNSQVKALVRREGLIITLIGIPIGAVSGTILTCICSAVLKFYNPKLYGDISLFNISTIGVAAGIILGFLTVSFSTYMPAKKAAKVSPVSALSGNSELKSSKRKRYGVLTKLFGVELAVGIQNAARRKLKLVLMSGSIAMSIIIFMGFSFLVNPEYMGMSAIKAYTPDLTLKSEKGISKDVYSKLSEINGVKRVNGRKSVYAAAVYDFSRLAEGYKNEVPGIKADSDGLIEAKESSWIISYDAVQLEWAKEYLTEGTVDEAKLNGHRGIIAVEKNMRGNKLIENNKLKLGDKVYIHTNAGTKEFTVMGVCHTIPHSTDTLTMPTFITTEKLFSDISEDAEYRMIDIQLKNRNNEKAVEEIKSLAGGNINVLDRRQLNAQAKSSFMTMAVFIYGFVGVIALISILNMINTLNTSVISKTKYLGIMRAVGMTGNQLTVMVFTEAAVYTFIGCLSGCLLGTMLRKALSDFLLADWVFPAAQIAALFIFCFLVAWVSILNPLKKVRNESISEVITMMR